MKDSKLRRSVFILAILILLSVGTAFGASPAGGGRHGGIDDSSGQNWPVPPRAGGPLVAGALFPRAGLPSYSSRCFS